MNGDRWRRGHPGWTGGGRASWGRLTAKAREDLQEISGAGRRMAHTIAALLEVTRTEATVLEAGTSQLAEVLADVLGDIRDGSVRLEVDVQEVRIAVPHPLAVRMLSPVVHDAVPHARAVVMLNERRTPGELEVRVQDDGPVSSR